MLRRTRQTALDAFQHQELPFERLVDALNPARDGNRNPLFQVMFTLLSAPWPELTVAGLALSVIPLDTGTSMFELSFTMREHREGLAISAEYRSGLFRAETIRRMLKHFQVLVEGIIAQPDLPIAQLPLLDEPERRQLLVEWNDTARDYPAGLCVHECFRRQVEQTPEATAVIDGPRQWTYRELDERANRLAHFLERRGVGPDHLVAVRLTRSAELIVAILGVLKAGGAYLPLDPAVACPAAAIHPGGLRGRYPPDATIPARRFARGLAARDLSGCRRAGNRRLSGWAAREPDRRRAPGVCHLHVRLDGPTQGRDDRTSRADELYPGGDRAIWDCLDGPRAAIRGGQF